MRIPTIVLAIATLSGCAAPPSPATDSQAQLATHGSAARGESLARSQCAGCHAVGLSGDSPVPAAPVFRSLGQRYPLQYLEEAFGEGIVTCHPGMPEFIFAEDEAGDLIAYLESINPD